MASTSQFDRSKFICHHFSIICNDVPAPIDSDRWTFLTTRALPTCDAFVNFLLDAPDSSPIIRGLSAPRMRGCYERLMPSRSISSSHDLDDNTNSHMLTVLMFRIYIITALPQASRPPVLPSASSPSSSSTRSSPPSEKDKPRNPVFFSLVISSSIYEQDGVIQPLQSQHIRIPKLKRNMEEPKLVQFLL